jgi:hypothetical protein
MGKVREFSLIRSRYQNDDQANRSLGRLYVCLLGCPPQKEVPDACWSVRFTPQPSQVDIRGADLSRWARPELDDRSESGIQRVASPRHLPSVLGSRAPGWSVGGPPGFCRWSCLRSRCARCSRTACVMCCGEIPYAPNSRRFFDASASMLVRDSGNWLSKTLPPN